MQRKHKSTFQKFFSVKNVCFRKKKSQKIKDGVSYFQQQRMKIHMRMHIYVHFLKYKHLFILDHAIFRSRKTILSSRNYIPGYHLSYFKEVNKILLF